MGIMDAFEREDRTQITFSAFYKMMKEVTKGELLMNAVNCDVPHRYIREMATGKSEAPEADQDSVPEEMKECNYDCPSR